VSRYLPASAPLATDSQVTANSSRGSSIRKR
jgi:hypothetical protein